VASNYCIFTGIRFHIRSELSADISGTAIFIKVHELVCHTGSTVISTAKVPFCNLYCTYSIYIYVCEYLSTLSARGEYRVSKTDIFMNI
jgi:hypothetical protein